MSAGTTSSRRPGWITVIVVGLLLHAELLYLFWMAGGLSRIVAGGSPADAATVLGIGVLSTSVAGWAGHVRRRRDWIIAGLIVIGLLYVILAGLLYLALRALANFGDY